MMKIFFRNHKLSKLSFQQSLQFTHTPQYLFSFLLKDDKHRLKAINTHFSTQLKDDYMRNISTMKPIFQKDISDIKGKLDKAIGIVIQNVKVDSFADAKPGVKESVWYTVWQLEDVFNQISQEQKMDQEQLYDCLFILSEGMKMIGYEHKAMRYTKTLLEQIKKDEITQNVPSYYKQFIINYMPYYNLFRYCYAFNRFDEAFQYCKQADQCIQQVQQKSKQMEIDLIHIQAGLAISSRLQNEQEKSKQIFDNIKNQLDENDLITYKQELNNIQTKKQDKSNYDNSHYLWHEDEDFAVYLLLNDEPSQAIAYYQDKLRKLSSEKDEMKIWTIKSRLTHCYLQLNDYNSALSLNITAYDYFINHQDEYLMPDTLLHSFTSVFKQVYFHMNDWDEAVEWGDQWYKVCKQMQYFENVNDVIFKQLYQHLVALKELENVKQALIFAQEIQKYLPKLDHHSQIENTEKITAIVNELKAIQDN